MNIVPDDIAAEIRKMESHEVELCHDDFKGESKEKVQDFLTQDNRLKLPVGQADRDWKLLAVSFSGERSGNAEKEQAEKARSACEAGELLMGEVIILILNY